RRERETHSPETAGKVRTSGSAPGAAVTGAIVKGFGGGPRGTSPQQQGRRSKASREGTRGKLDFASATTMGI
ncbi:MAG: hypothetical protein WBX25_18365, partial [Rhodomicrobium sp.]